jgi:hypothetical protein
MEKNLFIEINTQDGIKHLVNVNSIVRISDYTTKIEIQLNSIDGDKSTILSINDSYEKIKSVLVNYKF